MRATRQPCNYAVGLDIGGTNIDVGVVDVDGGLVSRIQIPVDRGSSVQGELRRVYDAIDEAVIRAGVGWSMIGCIGVAAPGTLDLESGVILHPFNLPGWENLPLADLICQRFGKPAVLVNDANAAAFAEYRAGSGRDVESLVLFTLGTGVGSGIVLRGQLWEGAHGHAGECGHVIMQHEGGPQSPFGIHGSLELYVGARAVVRRCEERLRAGRSSALRAYLSKQMISAGAAISAEAIATAADEGDALAVELILETADYLAVGAVSVIHVLNPEMILLGGAMTFGRHSTNIGQQFMQRFREQVTRQTFAIPGERTIVEYAALGSDGGVIGAATWAVERLLQRTFAPAERAVNGSHFARHSSRNGAQDMPAQQLRMERPVEAAAAAAE